MKCQDVKAKLIDLLFNDLDQKAAAEIQVHLNKCDSCRKEKAELENLLKMTKGSDPFNEPSGQFWTAFDERFEKRLEMESRRAIPEDDGPEGSRRNICYSK